MGDTALSALEARALERFRELGELVLVGDRDLDSRRGDARAEARRALAGDADSLGKSGIDLAGRVPARLPFRPGPARCALRGADGQALGDDLAGKPAAAFVVRNGEDSTRV